jgi:ABC-2 type transport system ATP-binding protein
VEAVPVVEIKHLVKHYSGVEALKGVSLSVDKGEIFGLLGENGAGKTTIVKILLGIVKPTEGEAYILNMPTGTASVRNRVGYLPEDHRFPDYHTGYSLLDYYGSLLGVPASEKVARIGEALEVVGLKKRMYSKIRTYSKGMKQRLGLAQAFFHDPDLIFLDEPTDGVDPVGRQNIREMLLDMKKEGKTIFVNSHLLGEVELLCDRVCILHRGEILRSGRMSELIKQRGQYRIGLAPGQEFPREAVEAAGYDVTRDGVHWEVALKDGQNIDPVVDLLRARGLSVRHLVEKRQTLEELFLETVVAAEPAYEAPIRRRSRQSPRKDS